MKDAEMEEESRALSEALRSRGIDAGEIETICGFVAYIDGVNMIPDELLDGDLPLAYEPQPGAAAVRE